MLIKAKLVDENTYLICFSTTHMYSKAMWKWLESPQTVLIKLSIHNFNGFYCTKPWSKLRLGSNDWLSSSSFTEAAYCFLM